MEFTENILASAPDSYKRAFACNLINSNAVKCMPNIPLQKWTTDSIAKLQRQHWMMQLYSANYKKLTLVGPFLLLLTLCSATCRTKLKSKHKQFACLVGRSQAVLMASGDRHWLYANSKSLLKPPQFTKKATFPSSHTDKGNMQKPGLWLMFTKCYKAWAEGNMKPFDPNSE